MTQKEMFNRASILTNRLRAELKPKEWLEVCELVELEILLEQECNK